MFFGKEPSARKGPVIRRILVVEDEPLVAFDNEHFLAQAGYAVVGTVDSYEAAVALIEAEEIDLVIADVKLSSERDGVEVAAFGSQRAIPVLFVTGACPIEAQDIAYGCLAKPYSQKDLLSAIKVIDAVIRKVRLPRAPAGMSLFRVAE
ncbi:response regulator [Sphingobium sp. SCG-1]|uniref:response regulator n=1 Tax=Sphingobium sp. SCG-1 TaxID=2072936 RepID=UPI000CD693CD|nr:response regulator [Sphingobium sp. SCG-1]AUW58666.1 response regulator [Sphingobium sp. SCG-1]